MQPLSHKDHRKFVETEGWEKQGTARGSGKTGDHHRYTLQLANGEKLYTRVSHGKGAIHDPNLVATILRDQLQVSEEDFYRCVNEGTLPPRPTPPKPQVPDDGVPASLVRNLIRRAGYSQADVANMTKDQAVTAWQEFLTSGGT